MDDPLMSGDPIAATAWMGEDVPCLEGDDVTIHAELTDVDVDALASRPERACAARVGHARTHTIATASLPHPG